MSDKAKTIVSEHCKSPAAIRKSSARCRPTDYKAFANGEVVIAFRDSEKIECFGSRLSRWLNGTVTDYDILSGYSMPSNFLFARRRFLGSRSIFRSRRCAANDNKIQTARHVA